MEAIFEISPARTREQQVGPQQAPRGLFEMLLGCWHRRMSRPFTRDGVTYRACLKCGAHRLFDIKEWRMRGPYYFVKPAADARPSQSTLTRAPERAFPAIDLPVQTQDGRLM